MSFRISALVLLLLFPLTLSFQGCEKKKLRTGLVQKVKDGDSFSVLVKDRTIEIRLEGVDCPEKGQPYAKESRAYSREMIEGKEIQFEIKGTDKFKRKIAVVYLTDGRCMNEELLKSGLAWHFTKYSKDEDYAELEKSARNQKRGLWSDGSPMPPWEYRSKKRKAKKN